MNLLVNDLADLGRRPPSLLLFKRGENAECVRLLVGIAH